MGVFKLYLKCVLHFFNFIFMPSQSIVDRSYAESIFGVGMVPLATGILAQVGYMDVALTKIGIENLPLYMMVVGSIIIVISIIGCCGGLMEHAVMLIFYSVFMTILMAASVLLAVTIFLKVDQLLNAVSLNITTQFHRDVDLFSQIEEQYLCCGPHGVKSYQSKGLKISDSCCAAPPCSLGKVTFQGCVEKTKSDIMDIFWIVGGTVAGLAVVQLFQAIVSSYLAYSVRKRSA